MIQGDVGDHRDPRPDHIRRIESPPHPHFHDGDVRTLSREIEQGHGGDDLEEGGRRLWIDHIHQFSSYGRHLFRRDLPPVDAESFCEPDEMGRRIEPDLQTRLQEDGLHHGRNRPLPVRARNMDIFLTLLWVSEEFHEV